MPQRIVLRRSRRNIRWVRITVLGGCGAWPVPDQGCSGYLVEHGGFRLLIDPGYGTFQALLRTTAAERVDAVLVSHGHPDHCADLNPLLRARALGPDPCAPLPVHSLPGALGPVLALDSPHMLATAYRLAEFTAGHRFAIGPFTVDARCTPHFVPNAAVRLAAGGNTLVYTGDSGPSPELDALAAGADVLLAEATFVERVVPDSDSPHLSTAWQAGRCATRAAVGRLVLTHLWPGTDRSAARSAARREYRGAIDVAEPGLTIEPG